MIALLRTIPIKKCIFWAGIFIAFLLVSMFTIHHLYPTYRIQGVSMLPTVSPDSKQKAVRFFSTPARHDIFIIDASQINHSKKTGDEETFIKRLVGLPGDTLTFRARDKVLVSINGTPIRHTPAPEFSSFSLTSKNPEFQKATFENHAYYLRDGDTQYPVYLPAESAFESPTVTLAGYLADFFKSDYLDAQPRHNGFITITIPQEHYFALSDNRIALSDSRDYGPVPASSLQYKVLP